MAASFSNNLSSLSLYYHSPLPRPTQPFKTLIISLRTPNQRTPKSISNSSPFKFNGRGSCSCSFRRSFRPSLTVQESTPQMNDEGEGLPSDTTMSESKADPMQTSSLKTLINIYKEAILDGDEKMISQVEALICNMENEKNELIQKFSAISAEIKSGKEKHIRLQADFDNFRKRSEKERLTIRSDAQGEVIESLLPMVDSFERAKQQIKPDTEKEKRIDTSYQGIYKQFVEVMRSLCVAAVPTVGKPFDPSVHEAIGREESQELKEGIVTQELRRGFLLGDRLLRPAMVKVSSGPGKKKPNAATEKSTAAAAGVEDR